MVRGKENHMENKLAITKDDCYLFGKGTHYEIYEKLGAHITEVNGVKGTYFAVWAPNATNVAVIGDFNDNEESANLIAECMMIATELDCCIFSVLHEKMAKFL